MDGEWWCFEQACLLIPRLYVYLSARREGDGGNGNGNGRDFVFTPRLGVQELWRWRW
ncbi:hypothetical protein P167DRAFT_532620 [Morchella conica CCBAS932]|uniref:Uncharacterized protein n=1 Tax=Morchella conica CCBAS932 TaxID=1392247 RepID=A0A3N4KZZ7_9PEZI|nr:hypothetical protein P167DRAFT_532620 [Morchella conica CCBAS932]